MLGFTKNEKKILSILSIGFLAGLGVRIYNENYKPIPILNARFEFKDKENKIQILNGETTLDTIISEPGKEWLYKNEKKININAAKLEELMSLPGVGPVLAERIVVYRQQQGEIHNPEQLRSIKGMGPKTIAKIQEYIIYNTVKEY